MKNKKILKAGYQGKLPIMEFIISCAVLEDETRILVERSVANAFGVKGSGAYWLKKRKDEKGALLPEYISAKYLKPYIKKDVYEKLLKPIVYINKQGKEVSGIPATVLPDICDIWITAREKGALNKLQEKIAENAYILLKGFAHIGIIALVDEATGFDKVVHERALHKMFEQYINKELLPWTKSFPNEFFEEIFRLNFWSYNPRSVKRPSVMGKWINTYVYDQLPPGVLEELKRRTPKDSKGRRKHRFHQLLTLDIGNPHLEKQVVAVVTLFRASSNWRVFKSLFNKAFSKQRELNFPDGEDENE